MMFFNKTNEYKSNNDKYKETIHLMAVTSLYLAIFTIIRWFTNSVVPPILTLGHIDFSYGLLALFVCFSKKWWATIWLIFAASILIFLLKPTKYAGGGIAEWFIYTFCPLWTLFLAYYCWGIRDLMVKKNNNILRWFVIICYTSLILLLFTFARIIFGSISSYVFYLNYLSDQSWKAAFLYQFTYLPIDTFALYISFFLFLYPMWKIYIQLK